MSRTLHDEFARDWMKEFLSDFGAVETEFAISGEVRSVDVYFEPNQALSDGAWAYNSPEVIGRLANLITAPCLIEPFRNAIPSIEICNCRAKSTILGTNLLREAKKEKRKFHFDRRPFLWMVSPTLSKRMQQKYGMTQREDWGEGVYFLPEGDRAAIIAVHQLPETPETIWLRLLGRGNVQKRAVAELMALPKDHPYRELSLRHIAVLQKKLKARQNLSKDLQEVTMTLSITYEQIESELLERGREEGREEGELRRSGEIALAMLREGMDPELVARLTKLPISMVEGFANDQLPHLEN
jgi:hypothetical protein